MKIILLFYIEKEREREIIIYRILLYLEREREIRNAALALLLL